MIEEMFVSSKGIIWNYKISEHNFADVWYSSTKITTNGWKKEPDKYMKPLTKEFKNYIKDRYGIEVR